VRKADFSRNRAEPDRLRAPSGSNRNYRPISFVIPALCRDPPGGRVMVQRLNPMSVRHGGSRHKAGMTKGMGRRTENYQRLEPPPSALSAPLREPNLPPRLRASA